MTLKETVAESEATATKIVGQTSRLKRNLESQTGFPAEIRAARIALTHGWTYTANPRFGEGVDVKEFDLLCQATVTDIDHPGTTREISLVIDVKSFNRPLVVFCSDETDRDMCSLYADCIIDGPLEEVESRFWPGPSVATLLEVSSIGRTAVIVNNDGSKPKDFDIGQVNSCLNLLRAASGAVQQADLAIRNHARDQDETRVCHFIIPVLLYNGDLYEYSIGEARSSLKKANATLLAGGTLDWTNQLQTTPVIISTLGRLPWLLERLREVVTGFEEGLFEWAFTELVEGRSIHFRSSYTRRPRTPKAKS